MQNIEVPDLAKDVQPVVTTQEPQEMSVHWRGHQSQIPRSEIGKGNHRADQEAKKAAYIPQAVLKVLGLIEEIPQLPWLYQERKLG